MFTKLISKAAVIIVIISLGYMMGGCNGDNDFSLNSNYEKSSSSDTAFDKIADVSESGDNFNASLYGDGNLYFAQTMTEVMNDSNVQQAVNNVNEMGYNYSEIHSFVLEYDEVIGPNDHSFGIIAMVPADGSVDRVIYIGVKLNGGNLPIDAIMMSFGQEPYYEYDDFELLVNTVWIRNLENIDDSGQFIGKADWSWKRWLKCSLIGTLSGSAGFAVKCALSGPGYLHCLGVGALGSAAASMVGCGLREIA